MNYFKYLFVLFSVAALFVATQAQARLGETEAQLARRFGGPTLRTVHSIYAQGKFLEMGPALMFKQGDWGIQCDMVAGRCLRISYQKPGDWTEDQIQLVLSNNGQGAKWTEMSPPGLSKLQRAWRRSDGSTATWNKLSGMVVTWKAYETAKTKAEERARVEAAQRPNI